MRMTSLAYLPGRGVLAVTGPDRISFLNGLVSNEISAAAPGGAVWAALLSAQGRYLTDFFVFSADDSLLLDMPREAVAGTLTKLKRFRLRALVELADLSESYFVHASWGGMPPEIPVTAADPRLPAAGFRSLSPMALETNATDQDYMAHRLALGLPDGPPDLEIDKTLLLEAGFDELGGVAWDKGCYMGQELTARTKYRGLIKRRLVPVTLSDTAPPPGTPILADGAEVGTLRSASGFLGLATLRLDALKKPLICGNALVEPNIPAWLRIPA